MPKLPLSVTLDADNLLWLRSRAAMAKRRSLSAVLDDVVTEARQGDAGTAQAMRSVVGTIDLDEEDPLLSGADEYVGRLFDRSLNRPMVLREAPATGSKTRRKVRRG